MEKNLREFVTATDQSPDGHTLPTWLRQAAAKQLPAGQIVLTSGYFSSLEEAQAELLPIARDLIRVEFDKSHEWYRNWEPSISLTRERVIQHEFVERTSKIIGKHQVELFRLFMLVNLSPAVQENFTGEWKAQIVNHRLSVLGIILGWFCMVLILVAGYFSAYTSPNSKGSWRWKTAITVATAAIGVPCGWMIL